MKGEEIIMKNIAIYVHGKGGSAQEAEHYGTLFPDAEVTVMPDGEHWFHTQRQLQFLDSRITSRENK